MLSKEAGRIELEDIQKEKYVPTEEDLQLLEKVLEENYQTSNETNQEPISPTEDELKKLEEFLDLQVKEDLEVIEETVVEQPQEVVEYHQPKKLSYLNRSGYGKSLRINRL